MSVRTGLLGVNSRLSELYYELGHPTHPSAILPELGGRSIKTMEKMTERYRLPPRYADEIGMRPLPDGVLGAQGSDGISKWLVYSPELIRMSKEMRDYVADHEGIHLGQPVEELAPIFMMTDWEMGGVRYAFHLGRALIEGLAEYDVEELGGKRLGAYQDLYEMSEDILGLLGTSSANLYRTALKRGPEALVRGLNDENVLERVYRTADYMLKTKGFEEMLTEGWLIPIRYG